MSPSFSSAILSACALLSLITSSASGGLKAGQTELVSLGLGDLPGNDDCFTSSLSADGRFVAFSTRATNLTQPPGNGKSQIVLRDLKRGRTTLVSRSGLVAGNDHSFTPAISANGRYVAFESESTNLVAGDSNGKQDIFRYDRKRDELVKVSVGYEGAQVSNDCYGASVSRDGRFVAFVTRSVNVTGRFGDGTAHGYLRDMRSGVTTRISVNTAGYIADDDTWRVAISDDGRLVAFSSEADNLDPATSTSHVNVFLRDTRLGYTSLVSRGLNGAPSNGDSQFPAISGNGRFLSFSSTASNLTTGDNSAERDVHVWDRKQQRTQRFEISWDGGFADCEFLSLSRNGSRIAVQAHKENTPAAEDDEGRVYVIKRKNGKATAASVNSTEELADTPSYGAGISANGKFAAFSSRASNLGVPGGVRHVYLRRP